jgi:hypothetical protein
MTLAVIPLLAFAISYYELFESKRLKTESGYNSVWLIGSFLPVGAISGVMLHGLMATADCSPTKRRQVAWIGAFLIGGIYTYLLFFVVFNTMGS